MLATLVDMTYPWRFVSYGNRVLGTLLLVMIVCFFLWANRRGSEGVRLLFSILAISAFLPIMRLSSTVPLFWISEKLGCNLFPPVWQNLAFIFTPAYVWALLVLTRTLVRRWHGAESEAPRCWKCGSDLGEAASGQCPRCHSAYRIVPWYTVKLKEQEQSHGSV